MHEISDEYLQQLWLQQPVDRGSLTHEAVEKKIAMLHRADRTKKFVAGLGVSVTAVMFVLSLTGLYTWGDSVLRGPIVFGALFLSCAWSFWSELRSRPAELKNVDSDLVSFIDYAIKEHERQLDVGISLSRGRFLVPSVLASLAGIYLAWSIAPEDKMLAGFIIFFIAFAQYLAHKGRMILRRQVSFLNALRDSIHGG